MNFLKFTGTHFPFPSAVSDGELANAATFNNQLASKEVDNTYAGKQNLQDVDVVSGTGATNAQRELNSLNSFLGKSINTVKNDLPTWTSSDVGSSTDNVKLRADNITAAFNSALGHEHDGSAGGGKPISAANLSNFNNFSAEWSTFQKNTVSGTSNAVSSSMTGKVAGGTSSAVGVYTSPPDNRVVLTNSDSQTAIEDAGGQRVYGRITEAATVWTLSFFTLEAGVETSHSLTSQNINVFFAEVFTMATRPTRSADIGQLPSLDMTADIVDAGASQRGLVSTSAQTFSGAKTFTGSLISQARSIAAQANDASAGTGITLANPGTRVVRLTSASLVSIAGLGLTAPASTQLLSVLNTTGNTITILNNVTATASERILTGTAANLFLEDDASIDLVYDTDETRWRVIGGTGSGTSSDIIAATVEYHNGDAVTTAFVLANDPLDENNTDVHISGVYQQKNTYSIAGTTLTFSSAPPTGTGNISVDIRRTIPLYALPAASVTPAMRTINDALGSTSTGSFTSSSTSFVDVTNATVSFTVSGTKPVEITLVPVLSGADVGVSEASDTSVTASLKAFRDAVDLFSQNISVGGASGSLDVSVPPGSFRWIDRTPTAGTYTYKIQGKCSIGSTFRVTNCKIYVREL